MNKITEDSHSNKALQGLLETAPLLWCNVFAIQSLKQNDDTEAMPSKIKSLCNYSEPVTAAVHIQPQNHRKRKGSSSDLFLNSSLTSSALRKYYHESEFVTCTEHSQLQYGMRKRKVNSEDLPQNSSLKLRKCNRRESAENIHHLLDTITPIKERDVNGDDYCISTMFENDHEEHEQLHEESSLSTIKTDAEPCFCPSTIKKQRLGKCSNLTSTLESFKNPSNLKLSLISLSSVDISTNSSLCSTIEPTSTEEDVSKHTSFPNIPASISISTCSSTDNLSQTSRLDALDAENSDIVICDGNKSNMNDVCGWFV